jgi:hypothetical protein
MIGRSGMIARAHNVVLCANRSTLMRREAQGERERERGAIDASESAAILFPSRPFLSLQRPFSVTSANFWPWLVCGGVPKRSRCWNVNINPPATCPPLWWINSLSSRLMNEILNSNELTWSRNLQSESNKIMAGQNRYASPHFLLTQLLSSRTLRGQDRDYGEEKKKEREIQSGFQPVSVCSPDKCQLISKKFRNKI